MDSERLAKIVSTALNKKVVPSRPKGRGRIGYGWLLIVRLLAYALLRGIFSNKGIKAHLDNSRAGSLLGFPTIPHRTTIGRWRKKHWIFFKATRALGVLIQRLVPTRLLVVDSTPIDDESDPEGEVGHTSRGAFKGFKVHASINQLRIPVRVWFTKGNRHDSPIFPLLLVRAKHVLGDAGYDSKKNRDLARAIGAIPHIARNRRRGKKKKRRKRSWLLAKKRYIVEQFNSLFKGEVLCRYWTRIKGFAKKASFAYAGILAIQVMAIHALLSRSKDLLKISLYRY